MRRAQKLKEFHPRAIKLVPCEDKYTAASGLATIMEVFDESPLSEGLKEALPKRSVANGRSKGSYRLGLIQINSFLYGHDCLEDLEEFREDPLLEEFLCGEVCAPKTMGDFLRDATEETSRKMNGYLSKFARAVRKQLIEVQPEQYKPNPAFTIDMDSTEHLQHGQVMEGCAWNYKGNWGLYSEVAYDELGFCHGIQLGAGNTKPGSTCVPLIEHCFAGLKFTDEKYYRADSAYCWSDVIQTLIRLGVTYTITAHDGNAGWKDQVSEVTEWVPWTYTEDEIKAAAKRKKNKVLPKAEVGRFFWQPNWAENLRIAVIVKRTWMEKLEDGTAGWKYYAIITNFNLLHHSYQSVMQWHQKRGGTENFIKEEKYGYDLKNFPCLELQANQLFAQLAMVAQNILRWVALVQKPDKTHYSKKIRRRYIYIPGRVIKHARQIFLKVPVRFYEEVKMLLPGLRFNPKSSAFASGFA